MFCPTCWDRPGDYEGIIDETVTVLDAPIRCVVCGRVVIPTRERDWCLDSAKYFPAFGSSNRSHGHLPAEALALALDAALAQEGGAE